MKIIKQVLLLSLTLLSMLLASSSVAEMIMHGTVREKIHNRYPIYYDFSNNDGNKYFFPKKHYEYTLHAYDLKYDDKVPLKNRKYNLNNYNAAITAKLDLISENRIKNIYKFKLSLTQTGLDFMGEKLKKLWMLGGIPFDADVKLYNGTPAVFFIEVSIDHDKKGTPFLVNSNNNKYFQLEFSWRSMKPDLIRLSDFPVILNHHT